MPNPGSANRPLRGASLLLCAASKEICAMIVTVWLLATLYVRSPQNPGTLIAIMLVMRVLCVLLSPLIAFIVDGGICRFRYPPESWLIKGAVLNLVLLPLIFADFGPPGLSIGVTLLCYLLWALGYTLHDLAFWAVVFSPRTDNHVREGTAAFSQTGIFAGRILSLVPLFMITINSSGSLISSPLPALAAASVCLAASWLFVRLWPNGAHIPLTRQRLSAGRILKNDHLKITLGITLLYYLLISLSVLAMMPQIHRLGADGIWSLCVLPGLAGWLTGFACFTALSGIITRRRVFIAGCVLSACGLFAALPPDSMMAVLLPLGCGLMGTGLGLLCVSTTIMTADCIDYGQFRMGLRVPAVTFLIPNLSLKIGLMMPLTFYGALMLNPTVSAWIHSYYLTVSPVYLSMSTALLPLLLCAVYMWYYRLHGSFFEHILNALDKFSLAVPSAPNTGGISRPVSFALDVQAVLFDYDAQSQEDVIIRLTERLWQIRAITSRQKFLQDLRRRMRASPAGIAHGIAIPHGRGDFVRRMALAVATLRHPLDFSAPDGRGCDLVFIIAAPDDGRSHMDILEQLSLMLSDPDLPDQLRRAGSREDILNRLITCENHLLPR